MGQRTPGDPVGQKYLRPDQAADYLGLSRSYLAKLRCRGGGPAYFKRGRRIFYTREELDWWMADGRRKSTSDCPDLADRSS